MPVEGAGNCPGGAGNRVQASYALLQTADVFSSRAPPCTVPAPLSAALARRDGRGSTAGTLQYAPGVQGGRVRPTLGATFPEHALKTPTASAARRYRSDARSARATSATKDVRGHDHMLWVCSGAQRCVR